MMPTNVKAFLDTIAWSEGTVTIPGSHDGYDVLVDGTLFVGYADHPRRRIQVPRLGQDPSTRAGRYQIRAADFDRYACRLGSSTFAPADQDAIAIEMISDQGALDDVIAGRFYAAVSRCSAVWSSFPGSGHLVVCRPLAAMRAEYVLAGGLFNQPD